MTPNANANATALAGAPGVPRLANPGGGRRGPAHSQVLHGKFAKPT